MLTRRAALALPAAVFAGRTAAQPAADTLRITWRDAVATLDPYATPLRTGLVLAQHLYDTLIDRDPDTLSLRRSLAIAWRFEDPATLALILRPGVFFHDGAPFGADDVLATVTRVTTDGTLAVPSNFSWLAGAEITGPLGVRLHLRRPFPAALEFLALTLPIQPRSGAVGVGSGPYRLAGRVGSDRIELERFEGLAADGAKSRPAIRRVVISQVDDPDRELSDLLSGQADWIWQIDPDRENAIARAPGLSLARGDSMRVVYLSLDAAGRSGVTVLRDARVRRAIVAAIDRVTIARAQGAGRVPDAPCFPTQFGCDADTAVRPVHDPAVARALLAEAGVPAGFALDLVSYVRPSVAETVRDALAVIGLDARIVQLPTVEALARAARGDAPLYLGSWGSYSINDVAAFLPRFFAGGPDDFAGDAEVRALVEDAGATADIDRRHALYAQAIRFIGERALWLPLFTGTTTYGVSARLAWKPQPDEIPRFWQAAWR